MDAIDARLGYAMPEQPITSLNMSTMQNIKGALSSVRLIYWSGIHSLSTDPAAGTVRSETRPKPVQSHYRPQAVIVSRGDELQDTGLRSACVCETWYPAVLGDCN